MSHVRKIAVIIGSTRVGRFADKPAAMDRRNRQFAR